MPEGELCHIREAPCGGSKRYVRVVTFVQFEAGDAFFYQCAVVIGKYFVCFRLDEVRYQSVPYKEIA